MKINAREIDYDMAFGKLVEHSYSGLLLLDNEFRIIWVSPSALKGSDWKLDTGYGLFLIELIHTEDREGVYELLKQTLLKPDLVNSLSFRLVDSGTKETWLEATFTNQLHDNEIAAIVCHFRDISSQKQIELQLQKQTEQVSGLLETMRDGFVALDENLCYTYANASVTKMLGRTAQSLIGRHIWDIFPDVVGSATWQAVETAFREKKYVCNEDFYAPLQLWQENRAYPSTGGVSLFIRDITKQKTEEHHLRLLESVITNTNDAVMITEAEPIDEPGPKILYVNEAFTRMTGYTAEDVLGKTPRILQGPKTDRREMERISAAMRLWNPSEATVVNYKKNGEEFWINFTLNPVANEKGWYTHWISIERDVTSWKSEELHKSLISYISTLFQSRKGLEDILSSVLKKLAAQGDFLVAETWLTGTDSHKISQVARFAQTEQANVFFELSAEIKTFNKGLGLPGITWESQRKQFWPNLNKEKRFVRAEAAQKAGLVSAYGFPLFYHQQIIGVVVLGSPSTEKVSEGLIRQLESLFTHLATEIKRKQLELELNQVFEFTPDILCIAHTDGYFKKVNPAASSLLEYSAKELLSRPFGDFIYPDDRQKTSQELQNIISGRPAYYIENRYVTKSGKIKWLAWTTTEASEQGNIYCSGKDVTEKKELEELFGKATNLARIGAWEIDLRDKSVHWSPMTREIHEIDPELQPDLETGIGFYKDESGKELISSRIKNLINTGQSFDEELQIITAKGNQRWVRVIGEGEFIDGHCSRVYGSFQDIDALKKAEGAAKETLEERNAILESIDDAFFAIDRDWTVTYWNNMAEELFNTPRQDILNKNLLNVFPGWAGSEPYHHYIDVFSTGRAEHFEHKSVFLDAWLETSIYPSHRGLTVYIRNITERKATEDLLKDSEKRYSNLFQQSPLAKWVFDLDTLQILDVNDTALTMYGYAREEFLQLNIRALRPAEEIAKMEAALKEADEQQMNVYKGIFTHRKKNGDLVQLDVKSSLIRYQGKNARVVSANDITERLSYIYAIEQQNKKMVEISWMQSHVIRAPLSRIMGLVHLADLSGNNQAELMQILEYIKISADELDKVVRNIIEKTGIVEY